MADTTPPIDRFVAHLALPPPPDGEVYGWRVVHPDLRSSNWYRWPFPGQWAESPLPPGMGFSSGNQCPQFVGDGLCIARTWAGAASGCIPALTGLIVRYRPDAVLGEDAHKCRVPRAFVVEVVDIPALLRRGVCSGADLQGANLQGANLYGANLCRAALQRANLYGANLCRADLQRANLYGADLQGANLYGANLQGANLHGAALQGANLQGANLQGAIAPPVDARERGALV
jgi:hypothetical protein